MVPQGWICHGYVFKHEICLSLVRMPGCLTPDRIQPFLTSILHYHFLTYYFYFLQMRQLGPLIRGSQVFPHLGDIGVPLPGHHRWRIRHTTFYTKLRTLMILTRKMSTKQIQHFLYMYNFQDTLLNSKNLIHSIFFQHSQIPFVSQSFSLRGLQFVCFISTIF